MHRFGLVTAFAFVLAFSSQQLLTHAAHHGKKKSKITPEMVEKAQKTWGEGVVAVGKAHTDGKDYKKTAGDMIDKLYAFQMGDVLFKPTLAAEQQFRLTRKGALSYFVAGDPEHKEDKGFAIKPWTKVRFENKGTNIYGKTAIAMGNYYFTTTDGTDVKVEYTFGYVLDDKGALRIVLHHSSMPYSAK